MKENEKNGNPLWIKANYRLDLKKEDLNKEDLAVQVPEYLKEKSFDEILDYLESKSNLDEEEKIVARDILHNLKTGITDLYVRTSAEEFKKCSIEAKVQDYIFTKSYPVRGKTKEIDLLEIFAIDKLQY